MVLDRVFFLSKTDKDKNVIPIERKNRHCTEFYPFSSARSREKFIHFDRKKIRSFPLPIDIYWRDFWRFRLLNLLKLELA